MLDPMLPPSCRSAAKAIAEASGDHVNGPSTAGTAGGPRTPSTTAAIPTCHPPSGVLHASASPSGDHTGPSPDGSTTARPAPSRRCTTTPSTVSSATSGNPGSSAGRGTAAPTADPGDASATTSNAIAMLISVRGPRWSMCRRYRTPLLQTRSSIAVASAPRISAAPTRRSSLI